MNLIEEKLERVVAHHHNNQKHRDSESMRDRWHGKDKEHELEKEGRHQKRELLAEAADDSMRMDHAAAIREASAYKKISGILEEMEEGRFQDFYRMVEAYRTGFGLTTDEAADVLRGLDEEVATYFLVENKGADLTNVVEAVRKGADSLLALAAYSTSEDLKSNFKVELSYLENTQAGEFNVDEEEFIEEGFEIQELRYSDIEKGLLDTHTKKLLLVAGQELGMGYKRMNSGGEIEDGDSVEASSHYNEHRSS